MKPLVTISIPTHNSGKTLGLCLDAIRKQTYKNIEINIVDDESTDETIKVAHKFKVDKIETFRGLLLEARYKGVQISRGKYIMILDSDQILVKDSIEKAIFLMKTYDMLAFEENVWKKDTFLEKLFDMDRKVINSVNNLSPYTGVIMPRFFKASLIRKAYANIPKKIFPKTGGPDHAVLYYEAWKISKKIGILKDSVKHMEPRELLPFLGKFYRWGFTSVEAHKSKYSELLNKKERFRTGLFSRGLILESLGSIFLLVCKGVPFKIGFYIAKITNK